MRGSSGLVLDLTPGVLPFKPFAADSLKPMSQSSRVVAFDRSSVDPYTESVLWAAPMRMVTVCWWLWGVMWGLPLCCAYCG